MSRRAAARRPCSWDTPHRNDRGPHVRFPDGPAREARDASETREFMGAAIPASVYHALEANMRLAFLSAFLSGSQQ